eukprot:TRINITY_DN21673_c0_g1_i1.p2 TRINITY_DN21673_c0_g1~~TRINITY_DN21673_c0_g1_i1.p2  ORF type:complete len:291 (+),score=82.79 TRINITY_DN21673_c0_g1_i1:82-873(+)
MRGAAALAALAAAAAAEEGNSQPAARPPQPPPVPKLLKQTLTRPDGVTDNQWAAMKLIGPALVDIRPSAVHGVGLFASRLIPEGYSVFQFDYKGMDMEWVPLDKMEEALLPRQVQLVRWQWATNGTHSYIPWTRTGGYWPKRASLWVHYINHNKYTPNVRWHPPTGHYVALHDIPEGTEITIDYRYYCPECYQWNIQQWEIQPPATDVPEEAARTEASARDALERALRDAQKRLGHAAARRLAREFLGDTLRHAEGAAENPEL